MSDELVKAERPAPGVVHVVLNDPERRNAMSEEMAAQFEKVISSIRTERNMRVVVLRGAGDAFSAGGNLQMLLEKSKKSPAENKAGMLQFYRQFLSVRALEVPVIAALNGHAVGAGCGVALACDIRIAKKGIKLGLNFTRLGLHPGMGTTFSLPRVVGSAWAAELMYTGRIFTAHEALQMGLVSRVLLAEQFDQEVSALAGAIAEAGPEAIRQTKASLRNSLERSLEQCLEIESDAQAKNYEGEEFLEGINAAIEKRSPNF